MPRWTENAASTQPAESVKQQDHLEFDDPDEVDEEEEEVEYEEVEEEVDYEEPEDEYEQAEFARQVDAKHDSKMVDADRDEDEKESHAELLSLPPHGSEVYVGGISSDVSSDDLRKLCESIGEVVEVSTPCFLCATFCIFFLLNSESFSFYFLVCRCECQERVVSCMLLSISELKSWL
jgi:heterogeneous nuclear ribonucleoprotein R